MNFKGKYSGVPTSFFFIMNFTVILAKKFRNLFKYLICLNKNYGLFAADGRQALTFSAEMTGA